MTATVVAIFVEKGKINWDSPVVSFFPELAGRVHPDFK
jgi:CubicO group peptidase (beta-lactamase class C family)